MSERSGLEIAILAMAGRFPGAADLAALWARLAAGEECLTRFSAEELAAAGADPALLARPGYVPVAGVLAGALDFDAPFFGLSARDAELLDPQHRLLLECAWEALEAAGYDAGRLPGAPVGVYAGCGANSYFLSSLLADPAVAAAALDGIATGFGIEKDHLAPLLAYKLGLEGPSVTVQTACSTGLTATHLACQALVAGECDLALAGAAMAAFPQVGGYVAQGDGFYSPDGHCRPFDARAAGTVPGSGVGVVVLKRLADALADLDPILAVILGSAVNNDGPGRAGYTAPRGRRRARDPGLCRRPWQRHTAGRSRRGGGPDPRLPRRHRAPRLLRPGLDQGQRRPHRRRGGDGRPHQGDPGPRPPPHPAHPPLPAAQPRDRPRGEPVLRQRRAA
jgi:acyl transferase domain-containing protein